MVLIYALITATLIVAGQALWKAAVVELKQNKVELLSADGFLQLIMTPKLIGGMFVYVMATVLYIVLLSKFNYFQVQSIVVGSSLVLTLLAATLLFNERPSLLNVVGIVLIVVGSLFVVTR